MAWSKTLCLLIKEMAGAEAALSVPDVAMIADRTGLKLRTVEAAALELGFPPRRYFRNIATFGRAGQVRLLRSRAAIIGAGGLGGLIIELLARAGVGELVIVDGDTFTDNNLNRQLLCREEDLGRGKTEVAAARVGRINPGITVYPHHYFFDSDNAGTLLEGCQLAIDALDSIRTRIILEDAAEKAGIPLVHGSIGGWLGQVAITHPGDQTFRKLYGPEGEDRGAEAVWGTPTPVPAVIASLQALTAIRLLLGLETGIEGKLLLTDLSSMTFSALELKNKQR